jgi:hypothetical protein
VKPYTLPWVSFVTKNSFFQRVLYEQECVCVGRSPRGAALPRHVHTSAGRARARALDLELAASKCVEDADSYEKLSRAAREHFGLYNLFLTFQSKRYSDHVQILHMVKQLGELEGRVETLEAALGTNLEA